MSSESRVNLRWPVLVVAAVVLLGIGAGAAYLGLRSRVSAPPLPDDHAGMAMPTAPAAGAVGTAASVDPSAPLQTLS